MTPYVAIMTLTFQVYGCDSLKEKRSAFSAMRSVWGKQPDLAVAEIDAHDDLDRAVWTIVTTGHAPARLQQRLQAVEKEILERIDAPILDTQFEMT
ncbi:MAG: DUF503 domain-containing protein [Halomonadaceae bacterium]|nr:MAG: DUF503 domain-containing protein [Halomonadaceae bacterium]